MPITMPPVLKYPMSFPAPNVTNHRQASKTVEQFVTMNRAYVANCQRPIAAPSRPIFSPQSHNMPASSSQTSTNTLSNSMTVDVSYQVNPTHPMPPFYFDRMENCYYHQKRLDRPNSTLPGKWHIRVKEDHAQAIWYLLIDNIHLLNTPLMRQYISHYKGRYNGLFTLMVIYTDGDERDRGHVGRQLIHMLMPYVQLLVHESINCILGI